MRSEDRPIVTESILDRHDIRTYRERKAFRELARLLEREDMERHLLGVSFPVAARQVFLR